MKHREWIAISILLSTSFYNKSMLEIKSDCLMIGFINTNFLSATLVDSKADQLAPYSLAKVRRMHKKGATWGAHHSSGPEPGRKVSA